MSDRRKYRRMTERERAEIVDAYASGEKVDYIAYSYGIDVSSVCRIAHHAGIPRRQTHGVWGYKRKLYIERQKRVAERSARRA